MYTFFSLYQNSFIYSDHLCSMTFSQVLTDTECYVLCDSKSF